MLLAPRGWRVRSLDWRLSQPGFDPSYGKLIRLATLMSSDRTKQICLWMTIYIYIYIYISTDSFVVSQLFSVARHVGRLKLGSKPIQLYVRLSIIPLSKPRGSVCVCLLRIRFNIYIYIYIYVCVCVCVYKCVHVYACVPAYSMPRGYIRFFLKVCSLMQNREPVTRLSM